MAAYYSFGGILVQSFFAILIFAADPVVSQNLQDIKLSTSIENVSLEEAFKQIEQKTDFKFFYVREDIPFEEKVTINVEDESLYNVLLGLAGEFNLVFNRINDQIVVKKVDVQPLPSPPPTGQIKGKITDAKTSEALIGANIMLKGTTIGVTTDASGNYRFDNLNPGKYTVVVKYVGYSEQSTTITVPENQTVELNFALEQSVLGLDEVVVTANLIEMQRKTISSAITIIDKKEIEQLPTKNIIDLFRGDIPGASSYDRGVYDYSTGVNLRGTNSLNGNTVKTYIDGVEVSDPAYTGSVDLNNIEKVELLRGPQATTLYGSDASGGVLSLFTKKGKIGPPHIELKLSTGTIASDYVDKTPIKQEYSLSVRGGLQGFTYNVGGNLVKQDPYMPEGYMDQKSFTGGINIHQELFSVRLTGQYSVKELGWPRPPILAALGYGYNDSTIVDETDKVENQTIGLTVNYTPTSYWQNTLTIGWDRSSFSYWQNNPKFAYPGDSLVYSSNLDLNKASFRFYSSLIFHIGESLSSTLTLGLDSYKFNDFDYYTDSAIPHSPTYSADGVSISNFEYTNSGYYAQWVLGVSDKLFITSGIRFESNSNFGENYGLATAPRIGLAYSLDLGFGALKPRVSYGKGIKPPQPTQVIARVTPYNIQLANPNLGPEQQVGIDGGFDFFLADGLGSFEATYYYQTAKDLIDLAFLDSHSHPSVSQFQNVGEIKNSGLELGGTLNLHPFTLRITYTTTKSTMEKRAPGYTGEYQPGDDIRFIPKYNGGATLTYSFPALFSSTSSRGGSVSLSVTYFGKIAGTDYKALFGYYNGVGTYRGSRRAYWMDYPGFAKFNLSVDYNISPNLDVSLNIKNLLNRQEGESSNIDVSPGRITMLGIKLNFDLL